MDDDGRVVAPDRSSCGLGAGDAADASSSRAGPAVSDAPGSPGRAGAGVRGAGAIASASVASPAVSDVPGSPGRALDRLAGVEGRGADASASADVSAVRARRARSPTECPELPRMHALADGELSPPDAARARAHAAGCAACRRELAFLRLLARAVGRGAVIAGRS